MTDPAPLTDEHADDPDEEWLQLIWDNWDRDDEPSAGEERRLR